MPFPDLPPDRIPGSPGHLNDHQLIDQGLEYIQQAGYRDDPDFPPLPDVPVLGQSGHVTAHDRILAVLEYVKSNPVGVGHALISNNPTGTYTAGGHSYTFYTFTASGTLTVTAGGLCDVLIVGGGMGRSTGNKAVRGQAGNVVAVASYYLDAGSVPVVVGAGGTDSYGAWGQTGKASSLGDLTAFASYGTASGADPNQNTVGAGYVSTITGNSYEYAKGDQASPRPNSGDGLSQTSGAGAGADGVVIVRVKTN